jgi:hypothetical protein
VIDSVSLNDSVFLVRDRIPPIQRVGRARPRHPKHLVPGVEGFSAFTLLSGLCIPVINQFGPTSIVEVDPIL